MSEFEDYRGCEIPPDVHARVFGWDPTPEIERLHFLAAEHGCRPRTALELGCGTGRLLRPLAERGVEVHGLELSASAAAYAREQSGCPVIVGDMTDFSAERRYDLIHSSANTIRHACRDAQVAGLWRGVRAALEAGGVFIADLEFGFAHEAAAVGKDAAWLLEHDHQRYRGVWRRIAAPCPESRCVRIEWLFERHRGGRREVWGEQFELRVFEADEFFARAAQVGLTGNALYESRDPYLLPADPNGYAGRGLAVIWDEKRGNAP